MQLLERASDIARLEEALEAAGEGSGRLTLVRGEAGMGKTSLIRAFLDGNQDESYVLLGACDDLLTQRPLGPIWDMGREDSSIASALAEGDRGTVYDALLELLDRRARPTILVLEDVHWADEATLDLIRHIGRRIDRTHGLLILTYRDEEVATDHPLRFILGDLPPHAIDRIVLQPLSEDAVVELAGGSDAGPSLFVESAGNPFFVTEMLASEDEELPASVVDAVHARVARLSQDALHLVELVSVVPGRAERTTLNALVPDWTSSADEAERRGVLVLTSEHVMFRHELARLAVEQALTTTRRNELNSLILEHSLATNADRSRIVHHALKAGDVDALIEHAPVAAEEATAVASNREAYGFYRTLIPYYQQIAAPRRAEILEAWSYIASVVNDLPESVKLSNEAIIIREELGDPIRLGNALRWRSRVTWLSGDRDAAESAADEAVAVLEPHGASPELAYAYSTQAQLDMLAWRNNEAVERAELAIRVAEEVGDIRVLAHATVNLGTALTVLSYPANTDVLQRGIDLAAEIGFNDEVARGRVNLIWSALLQRDLRTAEQLGHELVSYCEEADQTMFHQYALHTLALVMLMRGNWFGAEDLLVPMVGRPDVLATSQMVLNTVLGRIYTRRGDPEGARLLQEAWETAARTGELQRTGFLAVAKAEGAWLAGKESAIADLVERELREAIDVGAQWLSGELAFWVWKAGSTLEMPENLPSAYALLFAGDWQGSAAEWDRLGMPFERALALGEGDDAAMIEAVAIFDELGAAPFAARCRAELKSHGVHGVPRRPAPATRAHPAGLTARQAEVVELLAEGLSNPEIADRLFVSPRTVDHHVSAILTKLGVSTRTDAVDAASDLGVLQPT